MLITISRQFGAGGSAVARAVADALGWRVVDNDLVDRVASRSGLSPQEVAAREERGPGFLERLSRALVGATPELLTTGEFPAAQELEEEDLVRTTESVVAELAEQGEMVLVGRAAAAVLGQRKDALHVRLVADKAFRVEVAARRLGVDTREATRIVEQTDTQRERYHREYYGRDWDDPLHYHMVLNTGWLGFDGAADLVVAQARRMGAGRA
ncbi:MAG: AAA family ATPase [Gemmatimonadota bacterium]